MRREFLKLLGAFGLVVALSLNLFGADTPKQKKKQTPQGLYLTAKEAYDMLQKEGDKILFVDVRTPEELYFVGYPKEVDKNVPLVYVDYSKFKEKKGKVKFASVKNKKFVQQVEEALKANGLNKDSKIIVMCRSGHRSAKAAKVLDKAGYKNVYTIVDGFEGDKDKEGYRTVNGWKNAHLPYTYKVKKDIFILERPVK
ncbi:MAG: sulfurtransferase [Epsilonproteobacteria bacterium]|nr:sulfurtransferase [Campylobacterota bacterium]